ncbi:MAG TPA: NAD(P)/FAD-dependent oxidoreductase [Chromatiales bacterium]|nr:NAD(P)/FAD-dependent oxidoreductase [Thiotrichales bacterium]HIP69490.1 NAD(P)/FAD-dependent oxidoreductase [Chromatiales bacterium]
MLVIGGGPAGSTVAAFLREEGWQVTLLEKDQHPRFHIGESLLPMNLEIFDRLGISDKVKEIGIVKHGAEFNHQQDSDKRKTFFFAKALNKQAPKHAYQVRRSEFDHLLLKNAANKGVKVYEGVKVTDVAFHEDKFVITTTKDEQGKTRLWKSSFIVDATGRDTFLSRKFRHKEKHPHHSAAAIFSHFEGVERRPGKDEGNISLYWFDHGWFWMIPLKDGQMSVGAVCYPEYLKTRDGSLEDFFWQTMKLCPPLYARMEQATMVRKPQATGNYSYLSSQIYGTNYLLVGDAFAFVDPVFSSGVYIAMSGAERAAKAITTGLRNPEKMEQEMKDYERYVRKGIKTFSWFIYRFNSPSIRKLFMNPRNDFHIQEAIISVLAGDVYEDTPIHKPLRVFKAAYYLFFVKTLLPSWKSYRRRLRNIRVSFAGGTTEQD